MSPLLGDQALNERKVSPTSKPNPAVSATVSNSSSHKEGSLRVQVWYSQPAGKTQPPWAQETDQKSLIWG